ncbi:MAG: transcription termination factor Rho [Eggerthellaceae bacterium]|jgi:transcription termination factor Rho
MSTENATVAQATESKATADKASAKKPVRRTGRKTTTQGPARDSAAEERPDKAKAPKDHDSAKPKAKGKAADTASGSDKGDEHEGGVRRTPRNRNQHRGTDNQGHGSKNTNGGRNERNHRRQRRKHQGRGNAVIEPQTKREDLAKLKVVELRAKADELDIPTKGLLKADLVEAVYQGLAKKEGFQEVEGILDIMQDGYGFLRTDGYLAGEHDAYVAANMIRRNGLRKGDLVQGQVRPARDNEKYGALQRIDTVNGIPLAELGKRVRFADLTPVFPDERLIMEHGRNSITARVIDLAAPIGKGQRGLIVSPPKAGKTTILKDIAASITANNPEVHLMCLLVDERPEEVTDMERSVHGEVIASTFDMPSENHIAVAEMVIERAKRMVENGEDVVILLDSITRLARAYNLAQPASGRILSGGVDSTALYPPKRFLGAARNIEHGGSLTILASALIETGSKMDEVIFEEFKGTGNMELRLDRNLADRRIFPAIDPVSSGTRKEDLLLDPQEAPLIWAVRRILANLNNTERAMDMLIKSLKQTDSNREFLLRTAKKAQGRMIGDIKEF